MEKQQYIPQFDIAEQLFERAAEKDLNFTEQQLLGIVTRALAKARRRARAAGELDDNWRPELDSFDEDAVLLQRTLERAEIIQMLDSYLEGIVEGHIESMLLEDQILILESIYDFLITPTHEIIADDSKLGALTKTGYHELATNFGKSVLVMEFLNAIDAGNTRSGLKTLVLINNRANVIDFVGTSTPEPTGLAKFLPEMQAHALLKSREKNWKEQNIVVMTYDMFRNRVLAGDMADFDAGLILADEGHRMLGEETFAAFSEYVQGKLVMFLTATPESRGKHVNEITPSRISQIDPKTLIETGRASEVQLLGIATKQKVRISPSMRAEFTEKELKSLRKNPERSEIAIEVAMVLAQEGRRVLVNCIPGDECSQAIAIAKSLDGQEIFDVHLEKRRTLVAKAIHGYLPMSEQDQLRQDFKEGKIDILTQVDTLNESFDSNFVEAVVHARPVKSPRLGKQQFGRGMRHNRWGRTIHCYLLDDIEGAQQYTGFHALGEDHFEQGMVIGRKTPHALNDGDTVVLRRASKAKNEPESVQVEPQGLSKEGLKQLISLSGDDEVSITVVRELMIGRQEVYETPPEGWVPLRQFHEWGQEREMDIQAVRTVLTKEAGLECRLINVRRGKYMYFVPPESESFLNNYAAAGWAPDGHLTAHKFMEKMLNEGVPVTFMMLEKILEDNNIQSVQYRCRLTRRKLPHYTPEEQDKLKAILQERATRLAPKGKSALSDVAKEVDQRNGAVQFYLRRHHGLEGETYISPKTNMESLFYDDEHIELARYHFTHDVAPRGAVFIETLKEAYKVTDDDMNQLIDTLGFTGSVATGRASGKAAMGEVAATVYGKYVPQAEGVELERSLKAFTFERDHPVAVTPKSKPVPTAKKKPTISKSALQRAERARAEAVATQDHEMRQLRRQGEGDHRYSFGQLLIDINADEKYVMSVLKQMYNPEFVRKISRFGYEAILPPRLYEHLANHFQSFGNADDQWWSPYRMAQHVGVSEAEAQEAIRSLMPPSHVVQVLYSEQGNQRKLGPHFNIRFAVNVVRLLQARKARQEG